jgi:hypothetical protein
VLWFEHDLFDQLNLIQILSWISSRLPADYYITDWSLAALAATLSRTSPPLLTIADGPDPNATRLQGTLRLTDAGRDVLAGRRDRVRLAFDRWLGGVHLQNGVGTGAGTTSTSG